jgi:hypothetical protein
MLLAGRVSGDPFSISGGGGEFITIAVPDGAGSRLWAAYRAPSALPEHPLTNGDAIAVIGRLDPDRRSPSGLQGPIEVDAVLGLGVKGDIFGSR